MLQSHISAMARTIAKEVVDASPELAGVIRAKVKQAVSEALRVDTELNARVVAAIAGVMTEIALEKDNDR